MQIILKSWTTAGEIYKKKASISNKNKLHFGMEFTIIFLMNVIFTLQNVKVNDIAYLIILLFVWVCANNIF